MDPFIDPGYITELQTSTQFDVQTQQNEGEQPSPFYNPPDATGASIGSTLFEDQGIFGVELFASPLNYFDDSTRDFGWSAVPQADFSSILRSGYDSGSQALANNLFTNTPSCNSLEFSEVASTACLSPIVQARQLFSSTAMTETLRHENPHTALQTLSTLSLLPHQTSSRACDMDLYSVPRSRCTMQCYVNLNTLLTDMSDTSLVGTKDSRVTLDVLLYLEQRISKVRDRSLGCSVCMVTRVYAQTLMLITMVVENLLGLFESSCAAGDGNGDGYPTRSSPAYGRLDQQLVGVSVLERPTRARHSLPDTRESLTVGTIQMDDSVKVAFSRWVVRLYLDRQLVVAKELRVLLCRERVGGENAILKVTAELLVDIENRLESLVGFMVIVSSREEAPRGADICDLEI